MIKDDRESEIQELCNQVLNHTLVWEQNTNSCDKYRCVFCGNWVNDWDKKPKDIIHKPNCAYLIAKDLKTNL